MCTRQIRISLALQFRNSKGCPVTCKSRTDGEAGVWLGAKRVGSERHSPAALPLAKRRGTVYAAGCEPLDNLFRNSRT